MPHIVAIRTNQAVDERLIFAQHQAHILIGKRIRCRVEKDERIIGCHQLHAHRKIAFVYPIDPVHGRDHSAQHQWHAAPVKLRIFG